MPPKEKEIKRSNRHAFRPREQYIRANNDEYKKGKNKKWQLPNQQSAELQNDFVSAMMI